MTNLRSLDSLDYKVKCKNQPFGILVKGLIGFGGSLEGILKGVRRKTARFGGGLIRPLRAL